MARRKTAKNRRRKKADRRPLLLLFMVVAAVAMLGAIYLAVRDTNPHLVAARKPAAAARQKMPQRPAEQPATLEDYSSSVETSHGAAPAVKRPKVTHGTVAIIIDDMGSSMQEAQALLAIGVPVTFSIIPGLSKGREVAEAAHRRGTEVMVHIPMEPQGYKEKPFEKNGLLLSQSDDEIGKRVQGYLNAVPFAVGANNHMGSRFTEDRPKMGTVLKVLKGKGLFFIDSKTTPRSVGDRLAQEMGIPAASRNVFLDNVQEVGAIRVQLNQLAGMARKNGSAIGICHPHKTTLEALATALPALKGEGITFVYASVLVR